MADLEVSREGRMLRLTLNRPAKKNALNLDLCRELLCGLESGMQDREVNVVLLDAKGPVFCAGFDPEEPCDVYPIHTALFHAGSHLAKPLVAAVQGPALGAGLGLTAAAHVAIAAHGAQFGLVDIRAGHWPYAVFQIVAKAVGERRATELSLTGRLFGVNEALQYGLISEIAPAIELDDRVTAVAQWIAKADPEIVSHGLLAAREKPHRKETAS